MTNLNSGCFAFGMRKASRKMTVFFDRRLRPLGIRSTQFSILVALYTNEGKNVTDLSRELAMDRGTLSKAVKVLNALGYVSIAPNKKINNRDIVFTLSDKGYEFLRECLPIWREATNGVIEALTKDGTDNLMYVTNMVNLLL